MNFPIYAFLILIVIALSSCAIAPVALTGTGAAYAEMRRLNIEERLNRLEQIVCPEGCDK
jgi:protein-S-isoprenylcysteine O-methyltransferase Ste14